MRQEQTPHPGSSPNYADDPRIKLEESGTSRRIYVTVSSDGKEEIRCCSSTHYFIEGALAFFDGMHTHTHTHTFSWKLSVLKCLYGCLDAIAAICKVAGKLRDARRYRGMCSLLGTSAYLHAFYKQSVYVSPCASLVQRLHLVSFRCQDIFGPSLDSTSIKSTYLLTVWASCHRS